VQTGRGGEIEAVEKFRQAVRLEAYDSEKQQPGEQIISLGDSKSLNSYKRTGGFPMKFYASGDEIGIGSKKYSEEELRQVRGEAKRRLKKGSNWHQCSGKGNSHRSALNIS